MKIGVFDSGIGGITVLSELRNHFDFVDYYYIGDTAHVPYGTKSPAQIQKFSTACVQTLAEKKIDALVVACNTASSWAIENIRSVMNPVPVFEVVRPGAEAAVQALSALAPTTSTEDAPPVLVLATPATIRSRIYVETLNSILKTMNQSTNIFGQACPLLVPMIEEGWIDHPILHATVDEYVRPFREQYKRGVALLGCTHYPWIHSVFERALPGWKVVNSASAIVESLRRSDIFKDAVLNGLVNSKGKGKIEWEFTDPAAVPEFAREYYTQITETAAVSPENRILFSPA